MVSIPEVVIEIFHWNKPSGNDPDVDLASKRNEYQEYILGVKAVGAYGWQLYHLHMQIVLKSRSVNLLEPSGHVQACLGIALSLPLSRYFVQCWWDRGESRYNLLGPGISVGGPWPRYVTYVFLFLSSIIICQLYNLSVRISSQSVLAEEPRNIFYLDSNPLSAAVIMQLLIPLKHIILKR